MILTEKETKSETRRTRKALKADKQLQSNITFPHKNIDLYLLDGLYYYWPVQLDHCGLHLKAFY